MDNNSYWAGFSKAEYLKGEEIKVLKEKLDRTEKQRNALIIALNYVNNTMIAMKWGADARPEDMAVEKSEGSIKMEVKEDDK